MIMKNLLSYCFLISSFLSYGQKNFDTSQVILNARLYVYVEDIFNKMYSQEDIVIFINENDKMFASKFLLSKGFPNYIFINIKYHTRISYIDSVTQSHLTFSSNNNSVISKDYLLAYNVNNRRIYRICGFDLLSKRNEIQDFIYCLSSKGYLYEVKNKKEFDSYFSIEGVDQEYLYQIMMSNK